MSDRPKPLTPLECDLQDFPFVQVDVRRLLTSETWVLGTGDERSAALALWMESWHQVPAASLPNNPRMLAHLAQCKTWPKVAAHALRGWVECADGRLYHPVVAEKALEAWIEKLLNSISGAVGNAKRWGIAVDVERSKKQIARAIALLRILAPQSRTFKKKAVLVIAAGSPPDEPPDPPAIAARSQQDRKGEGQGEGEGLNSVPDGTDGGAPSPAPPLPPAAPAPAPKPPKTPEELAKAELWRSAVSLLGRQGVAEPQARTFIGKLLRDFPHGSTVMDAVRDAVAEQPAEACAWLTAACQHTAGQRQSPNRQEAIEKRNHAGVDAWAERIASAAR